MKTTKIELTKKTFNHLKPTLLITSMLAFTSIAKGAIIWEVVQDLDGDGVTVTKTGSFASDHVGVNNGTQGSNGGSTGNVILFGHGAGNPNLAQFNTADATQSGFSQYNTWDYTGNHFGFNGFSLYWNFDLFGAELSAAESGIIAGELRSNSGTIQSIFGPSFDASHADIEVWSSGSNPNDKIIVSFNPVPEPSSTTLVGFASLGLILRRKRQ